MCWCTVQVWFGEQILCERAAVPAQAERYAAAMRRRFLGLKVTTVDGRDEAVAVLPEREDQWSLTVK